MVTHTYKHTKQNYCPDPCTQLGHSKSHIIAGCAGSDGEQVWWFDLSLETQHLYFYLYNIQETHFVHVFCLFA